MSGHARRHAAVSCAKMAEPMEMPFGLWTRVSPRKHVVDGCPDPPYEAAIFRKKNMPWRARRHSLLSRAKVAESIELRI